jgi:hypothetical protein
MSQMVLKTLAYVEVNTCKIKLLSSLLDISSCYCLTSMREMPIIYHILTHSMTPAFKNFVPKPKLLGSSSQFWNKL